MAKKPRKAQSIIEFLTAKNPEISPLGAYKKRNTSRHDYHYPRELREWKEFNFETLDAIFGGELLKEANKKRSTLPHYPHIDEIDQSLGCDEPSTRSILTKWNNTIVVASLREVQDKFYPCLWRDRFGAKNTTKAEESAEEVAEEPNEELQDDDRQGNEVRKEGHDDNPPKRKSTRSRQPDGGSVSVHETKNKKAPERFPKEYKPASNWNSQKLYDGLCTDEETGEWLEHQEERNENAPIRQAYTYCVDFQCRYGCILTTKEAFIFRIQPRKHIRPSENELVEQVKNDGLMEFVSIPWGNGCDENHENYRAWTVNLALWFTHILAGNHYKLDWGYPALRDETIVEASQQQPDQGRKRTRNAQSPARQKPIRGRKRTGEAQGAAPQQPIRGRKRTRNAESAASQSLDAAMPKRHKARHQTSPSQDEGQDAPNYSFCEELIPQPQNRELAYVSPQSEQDSGDDDVDRTVEPPPLKQRLRSVAAQGYVSEDVHGEES